MAKDNSIEGRLYLLELRMQVSQIALRHRLARLNALCQATLKQQKPIVYLAPCFYLVVFALLASAALIMQHRFIRLERRLDGLESLGYESAARVADHQFVAQPAQGEDEPADGVPGLAVADRGEALRKAVRDVVRDLAAFEKLSVQIAPSFYAFPAASQDSTDAKAAGGAEDNAYRDVQTAIEPTAHTAPQSANTGKTTPMSKRILDVQPAP